MLHIFPTISISQNNEENQIVVLFHLQIVNAAEFSFPLCASFFNLWSLIFASALKTVSTFSWKMYLIMICLRISVWDCISFQFFLHFCVCSRCCENKWKSAQWLSTLRLMGASETSRTNFLVWNQKAQQLITNHAT